MWKAFAALPELPPAKVTLGDTINHKRHLDECLCRVRAAGCAAARSTARPSLLRSHAPTPAFPSSPLLLRAQTFEEVCAGEGLAFAEDLSWANAKMGIMAVASASALLAQFYPLAFPDNIWLLGACVAVYFFLSGVLQYMVTFLDQDLVYTSQPLEGGRVARLHTRLPKGSQTYSLRVEFPVGRLVVDTRRSVGEFFREDGYLVPDLVREALEQELKEPSACEACAGKAAAAAAAAGGGGKGAAGAPVAPCTHLAPLLGKGGSGSGSGSGSSGGGGGSSGSSGGVGGGSGGGKGSAAEGGGGNPSLAGSKGGGKKKN